MQAQTASRPRHDIVRWWLTEPHCEDDPLCVVVIVANSANTNDYNNIDYRPTLAHAVYGKHQFIR